MKKSLNIKTILIPLGLIFLLLLSPCKVRNFFEIEFNFSQTKVSNKSKSTIISSNCSNFKTTTKSTLTKEERKIQILPVFITKFKFIFIQAGVFVNSLKPYDSINYSISTIPLYILYQNFKSHL